MSYTMEDFKRDVARKYFDRLSPQEQQAFLLSLSSQKRREMLESLPPEDRLAGLSHEPIRQYLDQLSADGRATPRKPRRKR